MLTGTSINKNKLAVNAEARQNKREIKIGRSQYSIRNAVNSIVITNVPGGYWTYLGITL